ncbi:MAG: ISL3 family transposase, partial [Caldilineaceae bacterium]|nr:ISL3 family transposase [Caldilineaceae bacterium]
ASCPKCGKQSERVHSRYRRTLTDLCCCELVLRLIWQVRRFFCDNLTCTQATFAEQHPAVASRYARRTRRLQDRLGQLGYETGGQMGHRVLDLFDISISRDTLLRSVRSTPEPEVGAPRVIGLDDWALHKGHTYGTIVVDQERHEVIDLLPDREPDTIANWLKAHPGIEIVTRDRGHNYIEGVTSGAPEAIQVADRFHLLQNLTDTLKRMFDRQPKQLREAAKLAVEAVTAPTIEATDVNPLQQSENVSTVTERQDSPLEAGKAKSAVPTTAQVRFSEVKTLQKQGWSQRAVAEHLQMSRGTVRRYWPLDEYPQRCAGPQSVSSVTPYLSYLVQRWQEGCQNRKQLFAELQEQGFTGSYVSLCRACNSLVITGTVLPHQSTPPIPMPSLSAQRAAWLFSTLSDNLEPEQQHLRDALCQVCVGAHQVYELAQSFGTMIRNRQADTLDDWLRKAEQCTVDELRRFPTNLKRDYAAVRAALQHHWSNGPVEGQVNRLKLIKRSMYGRAGFDLLRKRVITRSTSIQPEPITEFA